MTGWAFVRRGLAHYQASYVGVLLGSALGAMVLLGALFAGDSVKETLRQKAEARVGRVDYIFTGGDRFFREGLATVGNEAPLMMLKGKATAQKSGRGAGGVQVLGVDNSFWLMAPEPGPALKLGEREVAVNKEMAKQLDVTPGDVVVLRFQKPGLFSRDAPMSGEAEEPLVVRGVVTVVVGDDQFGGFQLEATQLPVATVFMPLGRLQEVTEQPGRVNVMLANAPDGETEEEMLAAIRKRMNLKDYGLKLVGVPLGEAIELRSERIFMDRHVEDVVSELYPDAEPVVTYLANTIAANGKETPYSMVGAVDRGAAPFLPEALGEDGIVLNAWEAEDLGAKVGDAVRVSYYQVAEGNRLEEESADFVVKGVVPLEGLAADKTWMPDFPGMAEAETSADWSPGLPLDMTRIRDKDEDYWDEHKGTPKAFISVEVGRRLWGNRFGEVTALRIPRSVAKPREIRAALREKLRPEQVGMVVKDLRASGLAAASSPVDIGQLFLSMSFFLIVAAITLVAMLFRFNVELRNRESGLLAAVGVPARKVMRWRMWEALVVVTAGSAVALPLAMAYSVGILRFIETIWDAEGDENFFVFQVNPATVGIGVVSYIVLVMFAVWLVARKQRKQGVNLRLEAGTEEALPRSGAKSLVGAVICALLGLATMGMGGAMGPQGAFFAAGFLLLLAGLFLYRWRLGKVESGGKGLSIKNLAQLNASRRPARSLTVTGIMASGVFLVVAVAAFRKDTSDDWKEPAGGTGGYALWVETAGVVNRVGDGEEAVDYFELGDDKGVVGAVLPFRMGPGDDASCFNLNTVHRPRLLATDTGELAEREAFTIKKIAEGLEKSWSVLAEEGTMRAFVDETTLMWVLKAKVGDLIEYEDEFGNAYDVEIAGALADSVFQGHFVVNEDRFLEHYPSAGGYGMFLAEASGEAGAAQAAVQKSMADRGVEVGMTTGRLKAFHGVENTYIAIFHVLGGLGVILGAAGLGLVTARNLAERRYEFAVLRTVGIPAVVTRQMVFKEVGQFLRWGLGIGMVAAVVAIVPNLSLVNPVVAVGWVAGLVVAVALNAWAWTWLGYRRYIKRVLSVPQEFA